MNRALFTTAIAALGMTMFATAQIRADGHSHNGSDHRSGSAHQQGPISGRHGEIGHSYRASGRFDYGRHGFKSLSWTHYGWSDRYRTNCYWEPRYGWCFYEPSYGYYLPISYYPEIYPQANFRAEREAPFVPVLRSAPSVVQQTSVTLGAPPASPLGLPTSPFPPPVQANPAVLQQTRVNAGVP